MYIMKCNIWFVIIVIFCFCVETVNAADKKDRQELQVFLKDSEFALQRQIIKQGVVGRKGIMQNTGEDSVSELVTSQIIDPFNNTKIETKLDFELDDQIPNVEIDNEEDVIAIFRDQIDGLLSDLEDKVEVNPVEILNSLVIDRIMTSPNKYVIIRDKKYIVGNKIAIKLLNSISRVEFVESLDNIDVVTKTPEEGRIVEDMKIDALKRYDEISEGEMYRNNTIDVVIQQIATGRVEFSINNKTYIVTMQK